MSNPFRKKQYMSSSERTKRLSSKTMTQVINTKKDKASDINNCKDFYSKTMNHTDLLSYTKGYFQLKQCNNNNKHSVNSATQGKFSQINLNDVVKMRYYDKNCQVKDYYYVVDNCRHSKGLITPRGKINSKQKEETFRYPTPMKKIYCCNEIKQNGCGPCNIHCDDTHSHYFKSNSDNIHYEHNHSNKPHPNPYQYPNKNSTNFMSKFDLDKSLVGK
jgi:hypothetical protein